MLFVIHNYNTKTQTSMRTNTTTNNTQQIEWIIKEKYNEEEQKLDLSILDSNSGRCKDDWRSVLEYGNWTALRSLYLCNKTKTQTIVT